MQSSELPSGSPVVVPVVLTEVVPVVVGVVDGQRSSRRQVWDTTLPPQAALHACVLATTEVLQSAQTRGVLLSAHVHWTVFPSVIGVVVPDVVPDVVPVVNGVVVCVVDGQTLSSTQIALNLTACTGRLGNRSAHVASHKLSN